MFKPVDSKVDFPKLEVEILRRWHEKGIVKKYLEKNNSAKQKFSFLDGPITANNPMGVHHAWGRTYKDLWRRFKNMQGYKQQFRNGFDCQGLWIEVEVEKELGIRNKKNIENLVPGDKKASIAKFVELCKQRVLKFSSIQTEQSKRLEYFMDWKNSYFTMSDENNYWIWHFLKVCHEKGWIYKGRDCVAWCPRCETAISQHEMLTEDYKELTHETVFFKLPVLNRDFSLIAWTTTPWTIPANVAIAVNRKFKYRIWRNQVTNENIVVINKNEQDKGPLWNIKGKDELLQDVIFQDTQGQWIHDGGVEDILGEDLIGLKYKAPFDHLPRVKKVREENPEKFHTVVDGSDIVVSTEGTGLLHVAPGAGKEDFDLGKKENLSVISVIGDDAIYLQDMDQFTGKNAKKHPEIIIDFLKNHENKKYLFKLMRYTHRYPACWRCKTELVWKVTDEWYIAMDRKDDSNKTYREQMIGVAKKINWLPKWGLDRELDWLKNMHDWLISKKNRYWGLALPIFECEKCGNFEVIGSKEELKKKSVEGWKKFEGHTPHKPHIDEVKIKCSKCGSVASRINDVGNVWLDAGIVPFSTMTEDWFPADFITESFPGQFKNWFYSLIAMSTALKNSNPFKTVLGFASVRDEKGEEMHKSKGNSMEFTQASDKIGVDVMRWMYAKQDPEQNLNFGYKAADLVRREFHLMLWNIYNFFVSYANLSNWRSKIVIISSVKSDIVLDQWIISRLNRTIKIVTNSLEEYNSFAACRSLEDFVKNLSLWYLRRSRNRVDINSDSKDRAMCLGTFNFVLVTLSKLLAPFVPAISEEIYTNLTGEESVHLADFPKADNKLIDEKLETEMELARKVVELAHAKRKEAMIKVRQPLAKLKIKNAKLKIRDQIISLIKDEVNIKNIAFEESKGEMFVVLDTKITSELRKEGEARDIVRMIQQERKNLGTRLDEKINVVLEDWPKEFEEEIKKKAMVENLQKGNNFLVARK